MGLKQELGLKEGFASVEHEAMLNIYYTTNVLKKRAAVFFQEHDITDVQFNLMLLLHRQSGDMGGLTQVELSDMLLVNRANITSLIDRMQDAKLVRRTAHPEDRRTNIIKLTAKGKKIIQRIDSDYIKEVKKIMSGLKKTQLRQLINMCTQIREKIEL